LHLSLNIWDIITKISKEVENNTTGRLNVYSKQYVSRLWSSCSGSWIKLEDVLVTVALEDHIQEVLVLDILEPVCVYTLISKKKVCERLSSQESSFSSFVFHNTGTFCLPSPLALALSVTISKNGFETVAFKDYYQAFFWVLIGLIVEFFVLIIKPFDNQTES